MATSFTFMYNDVWNYIILYFTYNKNLEVFINNYSTEINVMTYDTNLSIIFIFIFLFLSLILLCIFIMFCVQIFVYKFIYLWDFLINWAVTLRFFKTIIYKTYYLINLHVDYSISFDTKVPDGIKISYIEKYMGWMIIANQYS